MMSLNNLDTIIIEGTTRDGHRFRPSDWAERMSGMLASFGKDHRIHYSPLLRPISFNGVKCVAMNATLQQSNPDTYGQIMEFAKRNNLRISGNVTECTAK